MTSANDTEQAKAQQVFISYAQADKKVAKHIADALRGAGLSVWFDQWELKPGDSILEKMESGLNASDILLVLLSPNSVDSSWVTSELSIAALTHEFKNRAVTLIPALIADCEVPTLLRSLLYLDLREDLEGGIDRLVQELGLVPELDFSKLDWRSFQVLVSDLLVELGFTVEIQRTLNDDGFDFVASVNSPDPFGGERRETWLVDVKLYRNQRVSLQSLRQMVGYLVTATGSHKGLVVTNSQLTSVARSFLDDITEKSGRELRVIDGTELRALLMRHPKVVRKHFGKDSST